MITLIIILMKHPIRFCVTKKAWNEVFMHCTGNVDDCTEVVYVRVDNKLNATLRQIKKSLILYLFSNSNSELQFFNCHCCHSSFSSFVQTIIAMQIIKQSMVSTHRKVWDQEEVEHSHKSPSINGRPTHHDSRWVINVIIRIILIRERWCFVVGR